MWTLLRDGPSLKVEQPRPIDISPECAAMLEKLCLAQAQECTFEKARQDKKKPQVLARYYCMDLLCGSPLDPRYCTFIDLLQAEIQALNLFLCTQAG